MIIIMLLINPLMSLIAIVLIPIFLALNIFIMKKIRPFFGKQQKSLGTVNGFIEENVSGLKIISLFKMKEKSLKDFENLNKQLTKSSIIAQSTTNILMPINIFMNNISFVLIAAIGITLMYFNMKHGHGGINPDWGVIHFSLPQ
jgi:ATP-binding cassette subfamily B protein